MLTSGFASLLRQAGLLVVVFLLYKPDKRNGKLKISYQRGVDDHNQRALIALKKLSKINVKLLGLRV